MEVLPDSASLEDSCQYLQTLSYYVSIWSSLSACWDERHTQRERERERERESMRKGGRGRDGGLSGVSSCQLTNPVDQGPTLITSFNLNYSLWGEGNGSPLQCSYLENSMDRGAWQAAVHAVTKSQSTSSNTVILRFMFKMFVLFLQKNSLNRKI